MVEAIPSPKATSTKAEDSSAQAQATATCSTGTEEKKISKKQIDRDSKKLKNKTKQAITVLCKAEDMPFETLFSQEPTTQMFVAHFGNGDEADQELILAYVKEKAGEDAIKQITILPGINYGHLVLNSADHSATVMQSLMEQNATLCDKRILAFFYTTLQKEDLKKSSIVDFPDAKVAHTGAIPGLYIFDDLVSEEESQELIAALDSNKWSKLLNRRVQHYGFEFKYGANNVNADEQMGQMPPFIQFLQPRIEHVLQRFRLNDEDLFVEDVVLGEQQSDEQFAEPNALSSFGYFDQCTVNDYMPGQGIPPHVDTHSPFEEVFAALSLKSGATMHFKDPNENVVDLYLKPRSLMVFSGEARYNWLHSIALRKVDKVDGLLKFRHRRVSLTFRKVKKDLCRCKWPQLCDSQNKSQAVTERTIHGGEGEEAKLNESEGATKATSMEKEHVYEVYEKIAPHFSNTRYKPWPMIVDFLNELPDGALVADVGCGNGKYLGINPKVQMIGTDRSFNLIGCAREVSERYQTFVADSLTLPLRSNAFDNVISIAVVHHFSSTSLRVQALSEMHRILKVGGVMLVYVWAYEQEHRKFATQDVFVPWHLHDTYEETKENRKEAKPEDSSFIKTAIQDKLPSDLFSDFDFFTKLL